MADNCAGVVQARLRENSTPENTSGLSRDGVAEITIELRPLLADTFTLHLKTKNFHGHMTGRHFRDYHLLLDAINSPSFRRTVVVPPLENGILHLSSPYSVSETLKRVESSLLERGLTIFCRIHHSGEAEKAGLKMHPTQLIIFGSPKGGTPVMVASPRIAIDLPLKALIWEDAGGKVWISRNSPEYRQQRHNVPGDLVKNISPAGPLLQMAVK